MTLSQIMFYRQLAVSVGNVLPQCSASVVKILKNITLNIVVAHFYIFHVVIRLVKNTWWFFFLCKQYIQILFTIFSEIYTPHFFSTISISKKKKYFSICIFLGSRVGRWLRFGRVGISVITNYWFPFSAEESTRITIGSEICSNFCCSERWEDS